MRKKCCITFAGVVGSSKTPIAYYLSTKMGLPIFNDDAIRTEVVEDEGRFNETMYIQRQEQRFKEFLATGDSFIFDSSVDRRWTTLDEWLKQADYTPFVISLDLSQELLTKICTAKGYSVTLQRLPELIKQHDEFGHHHNKVVGLHIDDSQFFNRLQLACDAVKEWLIQAS